MRKIYILVTIIILVALSLFIYYLQMRAISERPHTYAVYQVVLDDDKILVSDGGGPYLVPQSVAVFSTEHNIGGNMIVVQMSQPGTIYGDRNMTVRFSDTQWKSTSLMDIFPRLKTTNYQMNAYFSFVDLEFADVNVGDHVNISYMSIDLVDPNNVSDYVWAINRSDNASIPSVYVPPQLYKEGHFELVRDSQDVWIIDVDAWFIAHYHYIEDYYIRLSFIITITYKES